MLRKPRVHNDCPLLLIFTGRGHEITKWLNHSSPHAQDRQLEVPAGAVLVAVAEPLAPSAETVVGDVPRQPDVPGWKRSVAVEKFCERAAFTFKGRQIIPLCSRRQRTALFGCPTGRVEMIHGFRRRRKPDGFVVAGQYAAVYLAFVLSCKENARNSV